MISRKKKQADRFQKYPQINPYSMARPVDFPQHRRIRGTTAHQAIQLWLNPGKAVAVRKPEKARTSRSRINAFREQRNAKASGLSAGLKRRIKSCKNIVLLQFL